MKTRTIALLILLAVGSNSYPQVVIKTDETGEAHKLKNKPAPTFRGTTLDNKEVDLEKFRGKIILLDFWSLSCAACFMEILDFNRLAKKYPDDKFVIVSLMSNTKQELLTRFEPSPNGYRMKEPVFRNDQIDFQIIPDVDSIMKLYTDQRSYPKTFIIDQDGDIKFYKSGYAQKLGIPGEITTEEMLIQAIDRLLISTR